MRSPAPRVLLVAMVVVAGVAGVGVPVAGDAVSTSLSPSHEPAVNDWTATPSTTTATAPALDATTVDPAQQIDGGFDPNTETRIRIELSSDRDARWEVSVRYELTDADERSAFETAADSFLAGEIGPDATIFEGFAREANRNVDRTMQIEAIDRDVTVHEDPSAFEMADNDAVAVGELRLTFVWTAFLAEDGENLVLSDALTTPNDGTWLVTLTDDQTIEVATPEGYSVTDTPDSTAARLSGGDILIEGPQLFEDGERVVIVYTPTSAVGPPWTILAGAIILAALLIAGSIVGYRRLSDKETDEADKAVESEAETSASGAAGSVAGATDSSSNTESTTESDTDGDPEPDLSLLSDEERVERLLADSGGRMRQADIVSETGWSDAKVSQLLSSMTDAGRVEKLRLGRENLISLPDNTETTNNADSDNDNSSTDEAEGDSRFS